MKSDTEIGIGSIFVSHVVLENPTGHQELSREYSAAALLALLYNTSSIQHLRTLQYPIDNRFLTTNEPARSKSWPAKLIVWGTLGRTKVSASRWFVVWLKLIGNGQVTKTSESWPLCDYAIQCQYYRCLVLHYWLSNRISSLDWLHLFIKHVVWWQGGDWLKLQHNHSMHEFNNSISESVFYFRSTLGAIP